MGDFEEYGRGRVWAYVSETKASRVVKPFRVNFNIRNLMVWRRGYSTPIHTAFVIDWMRKIDWGKSDEFVYEMILNELLHPRSGSELCLHPNGWNVLPYNSESEATLTSDGKMAGASFPDKKALRILALTASKPMSVVVTEHSSYEQAVTGKFSMTVVPDKFPRLPQGCVLLGDNLLTQLRALADASFGGLTIDIAPLFDAMSNARILCGKAEEITALCEYDSRFAEKCEQIELTTEAISAIDANSIMNMIAGAEIVSAQAMTEELTKFNRIAFLLTLGYDEDVLDKPIYKQWRQKASDNDFMLGAMGRIARSDVAKIDVYAEAEIPEIGTLYFTSAGFIPYGDIDDGEDTLTLVPFSKFGDYLEETLGITPFLTAPAEMRSSDYEGNYPFSCFYLRYRGNFQAVREGVDDYYHGDWRSAYNTLVWRQSHYVHGNMETSLYWNEIRPLGDSDAGSASKRELHNRRFAFCGGRTNSPHLCPSVVNGLFNGNFTVGADSVTRRILYVVDNTDVSSTVLRIHSGYRVEKAGVLRFEHMILALSGIEVVNYTYGFKLVEKQSVVKKLLVGK